MREKEHMNDIEQLERKKFTRNGKKESVTEVHKSALKDHVGQCNHCIDWGEVKLPAKSPRQEEKRYHRGYRNTDCRETEQSTRMRVITFR